MTPTPLRKIEGGNNCEAVESAGANANSSTALTRGFHGKSLWGWVVHEEWCSDLG
jgi:hypothetical protein